MHGETEARDGHQRGLFWCHHAFVPRVPPGCWSRERGSHPEPTGTATPGCPGSPGVPRAKHPTCPEAGSSHKLRPAGLLHPWMGSSMASGPGLPGRRGWAEGGWRGRGCRGRVGEASPDLPALPAPAHAWHPTVGLSPPLHPQIREGSGWRWWGLLESCCSGPYRPAGRGCGGPASKPLGSRLWEVLRGERWGPAGFAADHSPHTGLTQRLQGLSLTGLTRPTVPLGSHSSHPIKGFHSHELWICDLGGGQTRTGTEPGQAETPIPAPWEGEPRSPPPGLCRGPDSCAWMGLELGLT